MKLSHVLCIFLVLFLTLNIPDYFTCTENCQLLRDYSKWLPNEANPSDKSHSTKPSSLSNDNTYAFNEISTKRSLLRPAQATSEPSIFNKNKDMLTWASVFKDKKRALALGEALWKENVPGADKTSVSTANKVRLQFNREIEKLAKEKRETIYSEGINQFPLEMIDNELFVDKESFIVAVERLDEYAEVFEILAEKLMKAIDAVFREKYTSKQSSWGPAEVYNEFFKDVAQALHVDFDEWFGELKEAKENANYDSDNDVWFFDFDTCILVARDNFGRMYYSSPLYNSHVFRFYKIN